LEGAKNVGSNRGKSETHINLHGGRGESKDDILNEENVEEKINEKLLDEKNGE